MTPAHLISLNVTPEPRTRTGRDGAVILGIAAPSGAKATREIPHFFSSPVVRELPPRPALSPRTW